VKRCRVCGEEKPLAEYYRAKGTRDGLRGECRSCNLARKHANYEANRQREIDRVLAWRDRNRDRYNATQRKYRESGKKAVSDRKSHLKRSYGITPERYDEMLREQRGGCAICGKRPGDIPLHVDHDHATGEVRGLLCVGCNNGLGLFDESEELFFSAMTYVRYGQRAAEVPFAFACAETRSF
jgi:hypothetical protein